MEEITRIARYLVSIFTVTELLRKRLHHRSMHGSRGLIVSARKEKWMHSGGYSDAMSITKRYFTSLLSMRS